MEANKLNDKFLNVDQLAEVLNVPVSWIYQKTRVNKIPHYKMGRHLRFKLNEVVEYFKKGT